MWLAQTGRADRLYGAYPSTIIRQEGSFRIPVRGTVYGLANRPITINGNAIAAGVVFAIVSHDNLTVSAPANCLGTYIIRHNYFGQEVLGVKLEAAGRLNYIDGCTDSVLISPPRLGDPVMNHLVIPPGTDQSFHTHPSLRMGMVLWGAGKACLEHEEFGLTPGDVFVIEEGELHRFRTEAEGLSILAFHPDSDFGPTDESHPMVNRTILP